MNKTYFFIFFILFPVSIFSQGNSDALEIKKEGLKEIRFFDNDKDSFPSAAAYYDKEGRLTKRVSIIEYSIDTPFTHQLYITLYDKLGRPVKDILTFCREKDIDKAKPIRNDDYVTTFSYYSDTMLTTTDSAFLNNRLDEVRIETQNIHWKKTPPPIPRPVLWPDSIETFYKEIRKDFHFYYQSELRGEPVKTDSSISEYHYSYSISNGKLLMSGGGTSHYADTSEVSTCSRSYTLNEKFDTVIWKTTNVKEPASKRDVMQGMANYNYKYYKTITTKKIGSHYFVSYTEHDVPQTYKIPYVHNETTKVK